MSQPFRYRVIDQHDMITERVARVRALELDHFGTGLRAEEIGGLDEELASQRIELQRRIEVHAEVLWPDDEHDDNAADAPSPRPEPTLEPGNGSTAGDDLASTLSPPTPYEPMSPLGHHRPGDDPASNTAPGTAPGVAMTKALVRFTDDLGHSVPTGTLLCTAESGDVLYVSADAIALRGHDSATVELVCAEPTRSLPPGVVLYSEAPLPFVESIVLSADLSADLTSTADTGRHQRSTEVLDRVDFDVQSDQTEHELPDRVGPFDRVGPYPAAT